MSTEPETPETEEEAGAYEPQPCLLTEDDCFIFDRAEFEQDFNCYAVMFKGGQLWALDKESRQWVDCAKPGKAPAKFKTVQ